jgi:hypothetical protein
MITIFKLWVGPVEISSWFRYKNSFCVLGAEWGHSWGSLEVLGVTINVGVPARN